MPKALVRLLLAALAGAGAHLETAAAEPAGERHLKNTTQLTFDGDNGEAYFSWDSHEDHLAVESRRLRLRQDLDHEHRRIGQTDGQS